MEAQDPNSDSEVVQVGIVIATDRSTGWIKVSSQTDNPSRYQRKSELLIKGTVYIVSQSKSVKSGFLLDLEGLTPELSQSLKTVCKTFFVSSYEERNALNKQRSECLNSAFFYRRVGAIFHTVRFTSSLVQKRILCKKVLQPLWSWSKRSQQNKLK